MEPFSLPCVKIFEKAAVGRKFAAYKEKNMKKKLTALFLALTLVLSLAACGNSAGSGSAGASAGNSAASGSLSAPETAGEASSGQESGSAGSAAMPENPETSEPSAPQTAQPAGSATSKPETTKPSGGNTASKPGSGTTAKPETSRPSGGSSSAGSSAAAVDLSAFYDTLSSGKDFPAMTALTGDSLDSIYAGLNDLKPGQCLVYLPMISAVACEVALVEAASDADVQKVKDIFQARIDYQIEQGAFYPSTVETWQSTAQIVSNGKYVMLICGENASAAVDSFNALFQ